jgi:YfiH family protein
MNLESPLLSAVPRLRHAFFTREGGVSEGIYAGLNGGLGSGDDPGKVAENRRRMAEQIGVLPTHLLSIHQIHSPDAVIVTEPWTGPARPKADAMVTRTAGLAIGVTTADCGPVLLADTQARVVGAAHAGWRGALSGVIEATLDAMERCGAARSRIVAALGPMIRQRNYEVGPDFIARFHSEDRGGDMFFKPAARPGHAMFDLSGYIAARLAHAGIRHIEDVDRCTYAEPHEFFSFRRSTHGGERDYGRHVNAIALSQEQ